MANKIYKFILFLIYIVLPISLGGYLFFGNFPLDGSLEAWQKPDQKSRLISYLYPASRVGDSIIHEDNIVSPLLNDNVYFDFFLPGASYSDIELGLNFYRPETVPEVSLGIPRGKELYETIVLSNKYLDTIDWPVIREGNMMLWQKDPKFDSISDFLATAPGNKTLIHSTAPTPRLILPANEYVGTQVRLDYTLAGSHSFFTYYKNKKASIHFNIEGVLDQKEAYEIRLSDYLGHGIWSEPITSTGNYKIETGLLEEGLYRLEFAIGSEMTVSDISLNTGKIIARDYLNIVGDPGETKLGIFGGNLIIKPLSEDGLQKVQINSNSIYLSTSHKGVDPGVFVPGYLDSGNAEIILEKGAVRLQSARGYFSWPAQDTYFDPVPENVYYLDEDTAEGEFSGAEFVLAKYLPGESSDTGMQSRSVDLETGLLYQDENERKLTFDIITPGISETCEEPLIQEVEVKLSREPLSFDELKRLVKKLFQ